MQGIDKNMEKQLIVRTFEPDMDILKQTGKQLSHMKDLNLNLYGNAGEVLIVITARSHAQAAATELTENIAEQFELALGSAAYGRGRGSLAYFTAGALIQNESILAAADPAMGAMLAEEFSHTKRGPAVFDFGESTYEDSRFTAKVRKEVEKNAYEDDDAQIAAARASAAARFTHADYGVGSAGFDTDAAECYIAVAHRKYVYIRCFEKTEDVKKTAALAALDIVRCLEEKKTVNHARMFRRDDDFDWNEPIKQKKRGKSVVPAAILVVLLVLLAAACIYFFMHFSGSGEETPGDSMQVNPGVSESAESALQDSESTDGAESETQPSSESDAQAQTDPQAEPESQPEPESGSTVTGVVTPFG